MDKQTESMTKNNRLLG